MNKFFIIGNLTKDPDLQETTGGVSVCRFTVAVNRPYVNEEGKKTDFFNCTAWRGVAESVARYCVKGSKVAVSGSVQMRQWEDNKGNKRDAVDIIAQDVEFLTPKQQDEPEKPAKRHKLSLRSFDDDGDILF